MLAEVQDMSAVEAYARLFGIFAGGAIGVWLHNLCYGNQYGDKKYQFASGGAALGFCFVKAIILGIVVAALVWIAMNWEELYARIKGLEYFDDTIDADFKELEDSDRPEELINEQKEWLRNQNRK